MELRWYQQEACHAAWEHLKQGQAAGNPVICLPTGAGKSLCIAELCRAAVEDYGGRVMVLAHRKELLEQNAGKIQACLSLPVGVHSAGLKRYSMDDDIVVAGIQSVFRKPEVFGRRHLCLIDEVHLVPKDGEGMYRSFLENLREVNPKLKLIGLTATPYRTGEGSVCSAEGMFQKICYSAPLQRLIGEGFLCGLSSTVALGTVDTSALKIRAGEFVASDAERLFDTTDNVSRACAEIAAKCVGRQSIMVFCSGVAHAGDVANELERLTRERIGVVTGESSALERGAALSDFKARRLRWLVNVDVLTTGFDAPCVDAIAVLRATASPGLFAQICGRGLRTSPGKTDCLILDFGENIKRHGPIDSADYGAKSAKRAAGVVSSDDPHKVCPGCEEKVAPSTKTCPCGFKFPVNHEGEAGQEQVLAVPQKFLVIEMNLSRHKKRNGGPDAPDTLRVDYTCEPIEGGNLTEKISEWVCLEHDGWARSKAQAWWRRRSKAELDGSPIDSAVDLWKRGALALPRTITAIREGKFFWRVLEAELDEIPDEWEPPAQIAEDAEFDEWGQVKNKADLPF